MDKPLKSFSIVANEWYAGYKEQVEPSTYSNYKYTLKTLKDFFRNSSIDRIRVEDINGLYNTLEEQGLSRSKISKCRAMLIQIFEYAMERELVEKNVATLSQTKSVPGTSLQQKAFTQEETEKLISQLPWNKVGCAIRIMLGTGMRVQEILGIRKEDIADDGSSIYICNVVKTIDGKALFHMIANEDKHRKAYLPEGIMREAALFLRDNSDSEYVWESHRHGLPCQVGTFRGWYYDALESVTGVTKLPPNSCRHTFIANQLDNYTLPEIINGRVNCERIHHIEKYKRKELTAVEKPAHKPLIPTPNQHKSEPPNQHKSERANLRRGLMAYYTMARSAVILAIRNRKNKGT